MIYVHIENHKYEKQIKYVFNNIFYVLGLSYRLINEVENLKEIKQEDILFSYDNNLVKNKFSHVISIKPSNILFSDNYMEKHSIPKNIRKYILSESIKNIKDLISIYNSEENLYINKNFDNKKVIETNVDFISDIFFMLTRYEEVVNREVVENEMYNRFSAKESVAFKNGFLHRPIVNEYIEVVWKWIEEFKLGYVRKKWWGNNDFAACLSHDVDRVQLYSIRYQLKQTTKMILKCRFKNSILNLIDTVKYNVDYKTDPYWTFDYIINTEKKYNFKSSFYFMSGGTSKLDNSYKINNKKVQKLITQIKSEGFEVGYHGSFNSFNNLKLMKHEKQKLDRYTHKYGVRQHYLRFSAPCTWRNQEQVGLLYDSTLSFADCEGFRCGTCFPFKPYDILENRVLNIWEIPLIVMDGTLIEYKQLGLQESVTNITNLIDTIRTYGGVFSLLWHNSSFHGQTWSQWINGYEKIMNYLKTNNCIATSGENIIKFIYEDKKCIN